MVRLWRAASKDCYGGGGGGIIHSGTIMNRHTPLLPWACSCADSTPDRCKRKSLFILELQILFTKTHFGRDTRLGTGIHSPLVMRTTQEVSITSFYWKHSWKRWCHFLMLTPLGKWQSRVRTCFFETPEDTVLSPKCCKRKNSFDEFMRAAQALPSESIWIIVYEINRFWKMVRELLKSGCKPEPLRLLN